MNPRPLGYEPYDARLRRLAWSLVAALTSVNGRLTAPFWVVAAAVAVVAILAWHLFTPATSPLKPGRA